VDAKQQQVGKAWQQHTQHMHMPSWMLATHGSHVLELAVSSTEY